MAVKKDEQEPETETVIEETEEVETEETVETPQSTETDEEPPAWFKKHLAAEAEKKKVSTVRKPTKTAPAKKTAPPAQKTSTEETGDDTPKRKRAGVSKSWFGGRADS